MSTLMDPGRPAVVEDRFPTMRRMLDAVANVTLALAAAGIVGMACVEGWQVFARYVLNDSPGWTEPVALFFMSTTALFGAALGVRSSRHFGFFMLVESARPAVRRALQLFAQAVGAGLGLMMAAWGGEMTIDAWGYRMPGAPLPQGAVYLPVCAGGLLISLFSVERMLLGPPAH